MRFVGDSTLKELLLCCCSVAAPLLCGPLSHLPVLPPLESGSPLPTAHHIPHPILEIAPIRLPAAGVHPRPPVPSTFLRISMQGSQFLILLLSLPSSLGFLLNGTGGTFPQDVYSVSSFILSFKS